MTTETFGLVSFAITSSSAIPYLIRVWRRKAKPSLVSFVLWTVIGLAMLLSYDAVGATDNIWIAVVALTNPLLAVIVILMRRRGGEKPEHEEKDKLDRVLNVLAVIFCVGALGTYLLTYQDPKLASVALWAAMIADLCAASPTIRIAWASPQDEQPFAWAIYGIGEVVGCFSITENTVDQWALPIYGIVLVVALLPPLFSFYIRNRIPFRDWM